MIEEFYYHNTKENIDRTLLITGLSLDELEEVVGGYFPDYHHYSGQLKGRVNIGLNGQIEICHHFKKRVFWSS